MLKYLLPLLLLIGTTVANRTANDFMDHFLNTTFSQEIQALRLDPADVMDFSVPFEDTVRLIGTVKGHADFDDGEFSGLSNAKRVTDCHGSFNSASKVINCTITWEKLKVKYDGKMKYGKLPTVNIKGKAKLYGVHYFIEIVKDSPAQPLLRRYVQTNNGTMEIKFTGVGSLNRFLNVLEDGYQSHAKAQISDIMEQTVHYAFNRALSRVEMPN